MIGYLAFKYHTKKELTLRALINGIALAICAEVAEAGEAGVAAGTRGSRQAAIRAHMARGDPGDLLHALFNGRALCLGGTWGEGQCRLCPNEHALRVCTTCYIGLDTGMPKTFSVCPPGTRVWQCNSRHLTVDADL